MHSKINPKETWCSKEGYWYKVVMIEDIGIGEDIIILEDLGGVQKVIGEDEFLATFKKRKDAEENLRKESGDPFNMISKSRV